MSNNNHTTGPWEVEEIGNDEEGKRGFIRAPRSGDDLVAEFYMKHNGPLISAAPDMFKALQAQEIAYANERGEDIFPAMKAIGEVELYESGRDLQEWANELREAALAKANGEQEGEKG